MSDIVKYHIYVPCYKWKEFVNNDDLRFFKHRKHILQHLHECKDTGITIKLSSWDYLYLKNAYITGNKIKHPNFVRPICYFEYEEDIVKYLTPYDVSNKKHQENAVILTPYYKPFLLHHEVDLQQCIKQIILSMYMAFYEYDILFFHVSIDDVYIQHNHKQQKIKYKINDKQYTIPSNYVVKMDEFVNMCQVNTKTYRDNFHFYGSILYILEQINEKYNVEYIISFIKDFHIDSERIICPLKVLDIILSTIVINNLPFCS